MAKVEMKIPLARPCLGEEEATAAREVILSGWVTQGPAVKRFETAFASSVKAPFAVATSSATTALHLSLIAVGVQPGDVVLTVSHSFIATANAVRYCGAEPVFVDIDANTLNMSCEALRRTLQEKFRLEKNQHFWRDTEHLAEMRESPLAHYRGEAGRLGAILVVHQVGMPCDMSQILAIAREFGVPVIEDAACAIGSEFSADGGKEWLPIGAPIGDLVCFSFHPRKILTTGDGGMITTRSSKHDGFARKLRHHGMSISDLERHGANEIIFENYDVTGFNSRMTDSQAAVGIEQLKRLPGLVRERRKIAEIYRSELGKVPGLILPTEPKYARSNWQTFMVRVERPELQRPVMQTLQDEGISTRRGIMCAHLEAPYRQAWVGSELAESARATNTGIALPMYPGMREDEIGYVVDRFKTAYLISRTR